MEKESVARMELKEKLQALRKQKGLTQEELAEKIYVSRTAVSKWESGRGIPNIESLKALSKFFSVSLDDLLSGEELLALAEEDHKKKESRSRDRLFAMLDLGLLLLFFLPFFGQKTGEGISAVSLLSLSGAQPYMKGLYLAAAVFMGGLGALFLLSFDRFPWWQAHKRALSLGGSGIVTLLFILGQQPYAAAFTFVFLMIKGLMLFKKP